MNKKDFLLRVSNTVEWLDEYKEDMEIDHPLSITVWLPDGNMYDDHFTEEYPELNDLEIEELCEGDIYYYGEEISPEEMVEKLIYMGFNAIVFSDKNFDKI